MPNNWKIFAAKTYRLELQFRPKLIRIIKDYRKDFIADLQSHGQHTAVANLQRQAIHPNLTLLIQSIYKTAGLTGAKITASELKATPKEQKAAGFGRNEQWIRDVINYLKIHLLSLVQNITETMRQDMLKILARWNTKPTINKRNSKESSIYRANRGTSQRNCQNRNCTGCKCWSFSCCKVIPL
jgi:hypothetical protein